VQVDPEIERLLEHVNFYRSLGFCVIPAKYGDKRPEVAWEPYQHRQPTDEEIARWFLDGKRHNIAIVCGKISGNLVVLDFDDTATYEKFFDVPKIERETIVVRTGGGKRHVYLRSTDPVPSFKIPQIKLEVRSDGNIVIAPPCFDEKTRILTKKGLKYFFELDGEDEVATLNVLTGELEYQKPTKLYLSFYEGPMIHFKSRSVDLLVTPNHNVLVSSNGRKFYLKRAQELVGKTYFFKKSSKWGGKNIESIQIPLLPPSNLERMKAYERAWELKKSGATIREISNNLGISYNTLCSWFYQRIKPNPLSPRGGGPREITSLPADLWLRFLGWWLSEGSLSVRNKNRDYKVTIHQKKRKNVKEISEIINAMGFPSKPRLDKGNCFAFEIHSKQLATYLARFGRQPTRYIPEEIKELSPLHLKVLLETLIKGDGYIEDSRLRRFYTSSKRLAEDVAEIAMKCGYDVVIHSAHRTNGGVLFSVSLSRGKPRKASGKLVRYRGYVWCVEVPNHTVMTERNGRFVWSGNSLHPSGNRYELVGNTRKVLQVDDLLETVLEATREKFGIEPYQITDKRLEDFEVLVEGGYKGRPPPCIMRLLEGVDMGFRNEAAARLTSYYLRIRGWSPERTWKRLKEWNLRNRPPLDERELYSVFRSIGSGKYVYLCRGLAAFCDRPRCKFIKEKLARRSVEELLRGEDVGDAK
jgi:hypothetical protein